ncbi:RHTO0S16e02036g1_1 [Rhodotorula toruloides]|uniref:RHTO0S16e02036g1_1 n=1 Tax=Rhodotorula toruloides TaxID=5286 RepID=A0A061BDX0_RHOTO|nr:RHTO0S16e02036g1_1 [Rhodotorula toruloides]
MATPPLLPHSGPAWTRKQQQTAWSDNPPASTPTPPTASSSPRKTPRTRPARSPYGVGGPAFANSAPLIAASLSGAGSGSVSTLSLPAQTTTQDAPYLTHIHRHHGQLTLVAPDNLGARRQPGTVDPPERRVDAGGGWGISPPPIVEDESAEPNVMKKKKRKKKSALEQRREKEEREKRERDILSAVQNAGRTPSPNRASAFDSEAVRSAQMGRTTSGRSLEVPGQQEMGRRRRSRSRVREGESRSVESSTPARHPRGPRPPPAPAVARAQSADNVQQATTSVPRPSRPPAEQRNPPRRPRPSPAAAAPPISPPASSATAPQPTPPPIPVLPPLTFSSIDDSSLDDHLSLGLLDPSMLLMSPPPAYTGRGEGGELPPLPSLGSAALGGREARRRGERYSMAPPGSPPPSALALSLPPPPPTSLPPPSLPPPPITSPSSSSSEASLSDAENDNDTDSFILHSSDPLVLAWEADRSAGIYSLDERIERDLERRRRAARGSPIEGGAREDVGASSAAATSASSSAGVPAGADADAGADVEAEADAEDDPTALALLRRRIALAERENNSRGVVRALSVHATRSMRRAGRAARERRGRGASLGGAAGLGEVREEDGAGAVEETRTAEEARPPAPAQKTPSLPPAPAAATRSSPSPASVETEPEPDSESDAETSAPAASARPSRTLTLQGHRMLAEAAERRMAAERAARARAAQTANPASAIPAEAVRVTEGKSEAEAPPRSEVYERLFPVRPGLFGASSARPAQQTSTLTVTAATSESSTAAPVPPPKSRPPPPPPPRSRPSSARNSLERSIDPSFAAPSPAPSTEPARTPSFRRPPPPPPPGASAILAARRASLPPTQPTLPAPPASTAEPVRRRPLPVPPAPLAEDRLDAFTALRMAHGELPSSPRLPPSNDGRATPRAATSPPPNEPPPVNEVEHPGPPLPRRPPRPAPASVSVSTAQEQPGTLAEVPEFSMYTDLDLLLARLEAQENGSPAAGTTEGAATEAAQGGENYDDFLLLSDVLGQAVPAGASPAELESLTVARVECERRRVTKSGKVKSKLSVVGVRCVDCAICLARFKVDQFAVVLPECLHIFHENCIRSWFRLSRVCPVCRAEVFPPRPPPAVDLLQ